MRDKVVTILRQVLNPLLPENINPEMLLCQDLMADSLDLIEIALALEEDGGPEITDEEIERWQTVQDVVDCMERR